MNQLEIEYFYPLTEQIPLDLVYEPSIAYAKELNRKRCAEQLALSGQYLIAGGGIGSTTWTAPNTIQFKPEDDSVGYWECTPDFSIWRKEKPNWLVQKMTTFLLGWKWKDK